MGNSDGFFSIIILILKVASWLGSGVLAWNWVEPEGFFSFVLFMISWGILGKIFDFALLILYATVLNR